MLAPWLAPLLALLVPHLLTAHGGVVNNQRPRVSTTAGVRGAVAVILAVACALASTVDATADPAASRSGLMINCLQPPASCYTPHHFRTTYGIQPLLERGLDGRGETVTVLAPAPTPSTPAPAATDIRADLATFDRVNHLPTAPLRVVTTLAGAHSPWRATLEEVEDTEIVHTLAPAAHLRVVLIPSTVLDSPANATADMLAGLRLATTDTDVTSFSWGLGEHYFTAAQVRQMHAILADAATHHVTVVAATGDHGVVSDPDFGTAPVKEVSLPAADPLVLAAGGTSLRADRATGAYLAETAWNSPPATQGGTSGGSGGGFSHRYARPRYQDAIPGTASTRGVPDVAGDADPQTGMALAVRDSGHHYMLGGASGTSAATPLWGGLMALADQYAGHDLGPVNPTLYRIASSPSYHQALHDITTGDNTAIVGPHIIPGYPATPGWDPATGWGSPNARVLIPLLSRTRSTERPASRSRSRAGHATTASGRSTS